MATAEGGRADSSEARSRQLGSWKEIAAYLGKDLRTVQRWEKREGLPVHRHMHESKGSVFAYAQELDRWRADRVVVESRQGPPLAGGGVRWQWTTIAPLLGLAAVVIFISTGSLHEGTNPEAEPTTPTRILPGLQRVSVRRVPLPSLTGSSAMSKDGRYLYICLEMAGSVAVVDLVEGRLLREIQVGGKPQDVTISADERFIFVGDGVDGIRIVELGSGKIRTEATGGGVHALELSPDGKRLYLAMAYQGLKRMDTATSELQSVGGIICPVRLAADARAKLLWVSCRCGGPGGRPGHDFVDVIDLTTERSVRTVGGPPIVGGSIAVSSKENLVAVDGVDACSSTRYDHEGCPSVPAGVFHVFRAADGKHLKAFATLGQGGLSFDVSGGRLIHADGQRVSIFETKAFRLVESMADNVRRIYFSKLRAEYYVLSHTPNELRIVPLPPSGCRGEETGLFFHLPGDGVYTDLAGGGHAKPNKAGFEAGIRGQAFHFDGGSSYLEMPKDGEYGFHLVPGRTYALWVKPSRTGTEEVIAERVYPNGNLRWRAIRGADDRLSLEIVSQEGPSERITSREKIPAGRWTSIAIVTSETGISLVLNGRMQAKLSGRFEDPPGGRSRFGAGFGGNRPFAGLLDEIAGRDWGQREDELKKWDERLRACEQAEW